MMKCCAERGFVYYVYMYATLCRGLEPHRPACRSRSRSVWCGGVGREGLA